MNLVVMVGIIVLGYAIRVEESKYSRRFFIPALIFTTLAILLPTRTTLYFMLLFSLSLLFENFIGKLSLIITFVMVILSPIFKFLGDTLGFPLRLWLSDIVAKTMTFAGMPVKSVGNLIIIGKFEFYIDQACAGLNMLHLSLLIALFTAANYEKKHQLSLRFIPICGLLLSTLLLNIMSNYFRILLIVIFKIMPGNFLHDFAGMICMVVYVMLPLALFAERFLNWLFKSPVNDIETTVHTFSYKTTLLILLLLVVWFGPYLSPPHKQGRVAHRHIQLKGYTKQTVYGDVTKLQNNLALIYLKPTPFYAPEHNPMICWTGSGYEFNLIRKETILDIEIYTATLQKGQEKIYAAWWFDDGEMKTTNQWKWRWNSAVNSRPFYLVNVNTARSEDLRKIVETLLPSPFAGDF
ncbi:exosortase N [Pedobacter sp. GR22-6]|uniref:exosortase N n=1 Tax=Pedobacter sp. GR22-6 TaxID=3127957 RepID=UPI00307E29DB